MDATSLQLRVSLRYRAAGDLTHAIVDAILARLRTREPVPYRHWFPTQVSDECDLWWKLETTEVICNGPQKDRPGRQTEGHWDHIGCKQARPGPRLTSNGPTLFATSPQTAVRTRISRK